jgi:hypothetical protein
MKNLDDQLKHVLRREDPPEGFAERVLKRIEVPAPTKPIAMAAMRRPAVRRPRAQGYRFAAAAAMLIAIGGGAVEYRSVQRRRAERAAGEAASAQVVLALEIAGAKLQLVQTKIHSLHDGQPNDANR